MKRSSPGKAKKLTHFDVRGQAHMVDVGDKAQTRRIARACGSIRMQPATLRPSRVRCDFHRMAAKITNRYKKSDA